jgi:hypothetical protein
MAAKLSKLNLTPKKVKTEQVETVVESPATAVEASKVVLDGMIHVESSGDVLDQIREREEASSEAAEEKPVKKDEWQGRNVFVGFPCYKQTNPVTAWCLVAMALDFGREKIRFDMEIGDAMIYHARNRLAMKFLETDAEWLLFLDDDMIVPIGRPDFLKQMARLPDYYPREAMALNTVRRLIGHGKELVGASYFARHLGGRAINSLWREKTYLDRARRFQDYLMPCDWAGTGCLLIHRSVFNKIKDMFPELAPQHRDMPWNFFQPMTDGRGEDIAFCARAKACGVQPHVDTLLHAIHVGHGTYGVHTMLRA